MSFWNAILMGIVQGLTEFLPVSSSGHLSILNNLFGMSTTADEHLLFMVLLHLGTLLSVFIVYWQDFSQMFFELLAFSGLGGATAERKQRYPAARLFMMLLLATLPLFLVLPFRRMMNVLNDNSYYIGIAMVLSGCALYLADKIIVGKKSETSMTMLDAILIGLCQAVAALPGLSRTGTTLTAGVAVGLKKDFALKFAFLLSVPAVLGSNLLALVDALQAGINLADVPAYLAGMAVSMVVGIGAIVLMRRIAQKGKFGGFAYYCWVAGVLSIILTMIF